MTKVLRRSSPTTSRFGAATALVASVLLSFPVVTRAQSSLPSTTCDEAMANMDVHFPPGMTRENGTRAFRYGSNGPFVAGGGSAVTISVPLTFTPGEDAVIKLSALDATCGGNSSFGTVFTFTFGELRETNEIALELRRGRGRPQRLDAAGHPGFAAVSLFRRLGWPDPVAARRLLICDRSSASEEPHAVGSSAITSWTLRAKNRITAGSRSSPGACSAARAKS